MLEVKPNRNAFKKCLVKKNKRELKGIIILMPLVLFGTYIFEQPMKISHWLLFVFFLFLLIVIKFCYIFLSNSKYLLTEEGLVKNKKLIFWKEIQNYSIEELEDDYMNFIVHLYERDSDNFEKYDNKIIRLYALSSNDINDLIKVFEQFKPS